MLGVDPSHADAVNAADDALRELMNITAGLVMRGLGDGDPGSLALDMPSVDHRVDAGVWSDFFADAGATVLDAEGIAVAIRVRRAA